MAVVRLDLFTGEKPARHPEKLGESDAQLARNTRLLSGALDVWRGLSKELDSQLTESRTIFRTQYGRWLEWGERYSVVNTIVPNDPWDRVYFARGVGVRVAEYDDATQGTQPHLVASAAVGVPSPTGATWEIIQAEADSGEEDSGTDYDRTYFYTVTFVNHFGEEGPPLPEPLGPIDVAYDQAVKINLPSLPSESDLDGRQINECRIYRSSGGEYLLVAQVGLGGSDGFGSWVDDVVYPQEPLASQDWEPPPEELDHLTVVGGNYYAASRENEILCSEHGLPHAWPIAYRQPIDYKIVALASFGTTLVALTTGSVYIGSGSHPSALALSDTAVQAPCASRESVVPMAGGVMYATPDGLCFVTSGGPQMVTQGIFTRDEWRKLNPESMRAGSWTHLYIAFYQGEEGNGALIFDPSRPDWGVTFLDVDVPYPKAVFTWHEEARLYLVDDSQIKEWNGEGAPAIRYRWKSRPLTLSAPSSLNIVRIWADHYPVTARVFYGHELQAEVEITSPQPHRIPGGHLGRTYSVEVEADTPIYSIALASSMAEIRQA